MRESKPVLTPSQHVQMIETLRTRIESNMRRHAAMEWDSVRKRLDAAPAKLWSLHEMERTGGEPDVVGMDPKTGEYHFADCSVETPKGRTSVCYDHKALESRKEHKPKDSASDMAAAMGIEMLSEQQYRDLQRLGEFDKKTSSWVKTPDDIRQLGGALFCDRRFGHIFVYHNGAESFFGARGFRGILRI